MSEWVSVKDRLPEWKTNVLVHYESGKIGIDWRDLDGKFILSGCGGHGSVTHWMPLPEPPKEG